MTNIYLLNDRKHRDCSTSELEDNFDYQICNQLCRIVSRPLHTEKKNSKTRSGRHCNSPNWKCSSRQICKSLIEGTKEPQMEWLVAQWEIR